MKFILTKANKNMNWETYLNIIKYELVGDIKDYTKDYYCDYYINGFVIIELNSIEDLARLKKVLDTDLIIRDNTIDEFDAMCVSADFDNVVSSIPYEILIYDDFIE